MESVDHITDIKAGKRKLFAISAALLICFVLFPAFLMRHLGGFLVFLGVLGEVVFEWKNGKSFQEKCAMFFALVLIIGVVLEIAQTARQDKEVSAANERATSNEVKVAELTKQNAELERYTDFVSKSVRGRSLMIDKKNFQSELIGKPLGIANIFALDEQEPMSFAQRLAQLMKEAGWSVNGPKTITTARVLELGGGAGNRGVYVGYKHKAYNHENPDENPFEAIDMELTALSETGFVYKANTPLRALVNAFRSSGLYVSPLLQQPSEDGEVQIIIGQNVR